MITKRIIPCLDVKEDRVVKGIRFDNLREVSNPVELAKFYSENGADELVFYDITASFERRKLFYKVLEEVAKQIFVPLTVGGGISTQKDFEEVLSRGADKVSVNSSAVRNAELVREAAKKYGSQCVVLSVDCKKKRDGYKVFIDGGRIDTGIDVLYWIEKKVDEGAGEVVINSMDKDGVRGGFDIEILQAITKRVRVPVIASGGAGSIEDFITLFNEVPRISAGLAASVFHYGDVDIKKLKEELSKNGILVRR